MYKYMCTSYLYWLLRPIDMGWLFGSYFSVCPTTKAVDPRVGLLSKIEKFMYDLCVCKVINMQETVIQYMYIMRHLYMNVYIYMYNNYTGICTYVRCIGDPYKALFIIQMFIW